MKSPQFRSNFPVEVRSSKHRCREKLLSVEERLCESTLKCLHFLHLKTRNVSDAPPEPSPESLQYGGFTFVQGGLTY